ncbi:MAG TPA: T9SS type A sorting domain-containing protein [Bacteroidales bacterium]|nr:T9SS type A sorting domain-containing protein [Bacteroidales bacterium]
MIKMFTQKITILSLIFVLIGFTAFAQKSKDSKGNLDAGFVASVYTITAGECINFTDMSTGGPTAWLWSFPGAQTATSSAQHPVGICYHFPGTYDVMLEVQNSTQVNTEIVEACIEVLPNTETPIADFVADYTTIPAGGVVQFTDLSQNGPFESYAWVFEGGIPPSSTFAEPTPVGYTTVGKYKVSLRVEDADGDQDSEIKEKYINVIPAATIPPIADFMADRVYIAPGDFINFADRSQGNPYIWKWFFEGAAQTSSTLQNPNAILYLEPGTYDVELIVESNMGIDTIRKEDYIVVAETDPCVAIPEAKFKASSRLIRSGVKVYFEDQSLNNPTTWNWYFQGGYPTYAATSNIIRGIEYNVAGFFDVSLSVNNGCGSHYEYRDDYILVFSGPVNEYCDTISNVETYENIYSPTVSGTWGEVGGHNGQKIRTYADKFEQHSFERIDALIVPVVKSQAGQYNSKVTFYIWNGNTVYPEEVLAKKDYFIRDIPENFNYVIEFGQTIEVDGPFFVGYKINYVDIDGDGISDDRFSVSIAHNRGGTSALNTLYVESNSEWATATAKLGYRTSSAIRPVTCVVDVNEFEIKNNIDIYPNPATEIVYISTGEVNFGTDLNIQVVDITGRVVKTINSFVNTEEIPINISDLPQGLYVFSLNFDGNVVNRRVMLSK